jgi:hypothetical protein
MKVHGQCHCGAITYEAEVEAGTVNVCHCLDCQTLTGSAFRANIQAPAQGFRRLSGNARRYIKTAAAAQNGRTLFARFAERQSIRAIRRIRRPIPCVLAL